RRRGAKPLAVFFETASCAACDELHREGFRRAGIVESLKRFDVARFALGERTPVTTPAGDRLPAEDWARSLGLSYTPSVVFFGTDGREAFRIEAYLRRSEEHTSELQSRFDLVCRLLLEKKKKSERVVDNRIIGELLVLMKPS